MVLEQTGVNALGYAGSVENRLQIDARHPGFWPQFEI
jgi:hypothetical protein